MEAPAVILSRPGIGRDGTQLDGDQYVDGLWVRWRRGRPQKIGGMRSVTSTALTQACRGLGAFSADGIQYIHAGGESSLTQVRTDSNGVSIGVSDRTPAGLVAGGNNLWQIEQMYDRTSGTNRIIAHAADNLQNIDSSVTSKIWYGNTTASAALTDTGVAQESGGIATIGPYLFKFGSNGHIAWSVANKPDDFTNTGSGDGFFSDQKIVRGMSMRGAGAGPAGLFWSLSSLIRVTKTDGTAIFAFDTLSESSTVLSSRGIIEFDGAYFWPGVDRFFVFAGTLRVLPNNENLDYFFDGLNFAQRQKVFAFKVPRFNEIWWCYPRGDAIECTHAVIYNLEEKVWYDTELPVVLTAGCFNSVYAKPFVSAYRESSSDYPLFQTETGHDLIDGSNVEPLRSYFETAEQSLITADKAQSRALRVARLEPDFVQIGDLRVTCIGRPNARSSDVSGETHTIVATPSGGEEETVPMKDTRRLMRFRFESNTAGGHYEMGKTIAHLEPSDGRVNS